MTEGQLQREIKSGWWRAFVTTLVGIVALTGSTYAVIAKITAFELKVELNEKHIERNDSRLRDLEGRLLPDGLERGQLQATLRSVQMSLEKIEQRLDRIERQSRQR